jgi:hypothetical protein
MACADVATAKAKAATAINLIIVFSILSLRGERRPPATRGWDASARLLRARREGKDRREQTTSLQTGGLPMKAMWAAIK